MLVVTETFFGEHDVNEQGHSPYGIDGYNLLHNNRIHREGGGIALSVKEGLSTKELHRSVEVEPPPGEFDNEPQFIIAEISSPVAKVLVAVLYRRPSAGLMPKKLFDALETI